MCNLVSIIGFILGLIAFILLLGSIGDSRRRIKEQRDKINKLKSDIYYLNSARNAARDEITKLHKFNNMLTKYLNLEIEETPSVDRTFKLIKKKKLKIVSR